MKPSEQNADIVRKLFTALASGDTATVAPYLEEQSLLRFRGTTALAGDHKGPAAINSFLQRFAALTAERAGRLELTQLIPGDDHVMARFKLTASRGARNLQTVGCQITRLNGGKVSEAWYTFDDAYGFDSCYE